MATEHAADRDNIEIRVLPFNAGAHPSLTGAFRILTMPAPFPVVGYAETPKGAVYVESPDMATFIRMYDRLHKLALDPTESAELISAIAGELQ